MSDQQWTPGDDDTRSGGGAPPPPPPPPSGGPPAGEATTSTGAGLGMRFLARLVDGLIIFIPLAIVFAVIPGPGVGGILYNIVGALVMFGYYVWMESNQGGTLAKQWLKLRVAGESGGNVTTEQSARRNWWLLIGIVGGVPVIGFLASLASLAIVIGIAVTISSDPGNQGFHDRMANARVMTA